MPTTQKQEHAFIYTYIRIEKLRKRVTNARRIQTNNAIIQTEIILFFSLFFYESSSTYLPNDDHTHKMLVGNKLATVIIPYKFSAFRPPRFYDYIYMHKYIFILVWYIYYIGICILWTRQLFNWLNLTYIFFPARVHVVIQIACCT